MDTRRQVCLTPARTPTLLAIFISCCLLRTAAQAGEADPCTTALHRPLIAGASVSADTGAISPGKRLALRYTDSDDILTIARGGAASIAILPFLSESVLAERSTVIAIDLFFWDSVAPACSTAISGMSNLLERTRKLAIPVVLGDIPALMPDMQPCRDALNEAIRHQCQQPGCQIVPIDAFNEELMQSGSVTIHGKQYGADELIPDGLHLSEVAADFFAEQIADQLTCGFPQNL